MKTSNRRRVLRRVLLVLAQLALAALLACLLPLRQSVDRTLQGIRWTEGEDAWEVVTVRLRGTLSRYLLRADRFSEGRLTIDGETYAVYPREFLPSCEVETIKLEYYDSRTHDFRILGTLYTDDWMASFVIDDFFPYDVFPQKGEETILLAAPADNLQQAQALWADLWARSYDPFPAA